MAEAIETVKITLTITDGDEKRVEELTIPKSDLEWFETVKGAKVLTTKTKE